jgi:hypothetical protein
MLDLENLTAAPWQLVWCGAQSGCASGYVQNGTRTPCHFFHDCKADGEFIALARNALDIMLRRHWWPVAFRCDEDQGRAWHVSSSCVPPEMRRFAAQQWCADPFTAIVEADQWCRENLEKAKA